MCPASTEPAKFNEWKFRVQTRQRKEKSMSAEELKKLGPLGLRLLDGLSGHALQLAQFMNMDKLDGPEGADFLIKELETQLRPRRTQQARELYEAGARVGGYLSRQAAEPMVSYILRRRAWYQNLCDLSSELKLPDLVLAEQLLDNSNISQDHKLLVRTALQQNLTFDRVADELINQHSHVHERFQGQGAPRRSFGGDGRGPWRPAWTPQHPKGSHGKGKGKSQYAFHVDQDFGDYGDDDPEDQYDPAGYMTQNCEYGYDEHMDFEVTEFAEEHLAYLMDQGLDPDDREAGDFAADVIQAEEEAYWSRKGAHSKGHAPMKPPPFEVSGSFTMDEKKARLLSLKARTSCRKCGAVGHWSGDAQCPLNRGKGKFGKSGGGAPSSSSSGFGRGRAPGRGTQHSGRGGGKDKPRTVYFSIREPDAGDPKGFLALRSPDPTGGYRQVPPPSSLTSAPPATSAAATSSSTTPATATSAAPTQNVAAARTIVDLTDKDGPWQVIPCMDQVDYVNAEQPDVDMEMLLEALGGVPLEPLPLTSPASSPSPGAEPLDDAAARVAQPAQGMRRVAPHSRSCPHTRTTASGSNQYYHIRKCTACGEVLERTRKQPQDPAPQPKAAAAPACLHHRVHWKGSNAFLRMRTCLDCGFRESIPRADGDGNVPGASSSTTGTSSTATSARPSNAAASATRHDLDGYVLSPPEIQQIVGTFNEAVGRRLEATGDAPIPADRLLEALRLTIEQVTIWHQRQAAPASTTPSTRASDTASLAERVRMRGETRVESGKYKNQAYITAYEDRDYKHWCYANVTDQSHPTMKRLVQYFREHDAYLDSDAQNRHAYMAYLDHDDEDDTIFAEGDLVAILDTGCSQTCHGDAWLPRYVDATRQEMPKLCTEDRPNFRGIGGAIQTAGTRQLELCLELLDGGVARGDLYSTELIGSEAPLLLSLQAQKALGLVIDLSAEVAHSQVLGKDLKLVIKDGLLGLRLLPADVADESKDHETAGGANDIGDYDNFTTDGKQDVEQDTERASNPVHEHDGITNSDDEASEDGYGTDGGVENTAIGYLAVDALKSKIMSKGQSARVSRDIEDITATDQILWGQMLGKKTRRPSFLPRGCRTFLLELVAGAAVLTHMASCDYGLPVSDPVDVRLGPGLDLLTRDGRDAVDRIIERDDPYAITCSPVCATWSTWTNMLAGDSWEKCLEERRRWTPVIEWLQSTARKRLAKGRQFLFEHPWGSAIWRLPMSRRLLEQPPHDVFTMEPLEAVRADLCQFGLKDAKNNFPRQRPTAFVTATAELKKRLARLCPGTHLHQPLEEADHTRRAQEWTPKLCKAILDGMLESLENTSVQTAFPAEAELEDEIVDDDDPGSLDAILTPDDEATALSDGVIFGNRRQDEHLDTIREETAPPVLPEVEAAPLMASRNAWRQLPRSQRVALRRLHTMTGHSSAAAMQRLLRTAGADPAAIKALNHFHCPACACVQRPNEPRPVKMPNEHTFNKNISIDVFIVRDVDGVKYKYLSAVDNGTLYHAVWLVGTGHGPPSSSSCATKFRDGWLSWAGAPETVTLDRGSENRGKFQAMLKSHGTLLRYTGLESPFQLGRGERQGAVMKDIMRRVVASRQLQGQEAMEMLGVEAATVKNNRLHHAGFTPSQWVLGRLPPEVDSLTSPLAPDRLGQHQEIHDGQTAFARQAAIRSAARQAFSQADSSERIRAALLRKSVPMRGPFVQGDLVCFRRKAGPGPHKWFGPARVVGQEGRSTLWIVHGGIPLTVSVEQVRFATGAEAFAKRQLELKPSRKRRREDLDGVDSDDHDYPFGDDLSGAGTAAGAQGTFFDISEPVPASAPSLIPSHGPAPPPGLPGPPDGPGGVAPPPVLPGPSPDQLPGVDVPVPDSPLAPTTEISSEPDQEHMPPSRRDSTEIQPAGPPVTFTPLQQAMHRSVDALDGHPARKRELSPSVRTEPTFERRPPPGLPPPSSTETATGASTASTSSRAFGAFLAKRTVNKKSAAARAKELNFNKSEGKQREGIAQARGKEWNNWKDFDAVDVIPPSQVDAFLKEHSDIGVTPMRWVDTNKAQPWEEARYKSRIVVRGDLESGAADARTDSPTCSSLMLNFMLSTCASKRWKIRGGDITASFLQGEPMERTLILSPPPGGLPGVEPGSLLVARKPVYGTRDAPRGFWRRLHRVCLEQGLEAIPLEHACYVLKKEGRVAGVLISHVDDILWAGEQQMQDIAARLRNEFKFGTLDDDKLIEYCGRQIFQDVDGIRVSCPNPAAKVRPIHLDGQRRKMRGAEATDSERGQLRSVVGTLNWLVRVCRIDIAYQVHRLQTVLKTCTVDDLLSCNQLLSYVKSTPNKGLFFPYGAMEIEDAKVLSITDASHAADFDTSQDGKRLGYRSQAGRLLVLCGHDFLENSGGQVYILGYHSNVIRRVCRSTLQAETLALI